MNEKEAIKHLEQGSCKDAISRQEVLENAYKISGYDRNAYVVDVAVIESLPPVTPQTKMERCKDCRWWKDSDGSYRRGVGAESQCPINRREVYEGNGYCYMFAPQENEVGKNEN